MHITITLPTESLGSDEPRRQALELLEEGLTQGIAPEPVPMGGERTKITVYLKNLLVTKLAGVAGDPALSKRAAGVIYATYQTRLAAQRAAGKGSSPPAGTVAGFRPEQTKIIERMLPALDRGEIVLCEAGTGVGKSRVIGHLAGRYAEHSPVVVAGPTAHVVAHLVAEYLQLEFPGRNKTPKVSVLLGKQQFVSPIALAKLIDEGDADGGELPGTEQARAWLEGGGVGASSKTQPLHALHPQLRWLAADLEAAAPDFPLDGAELSEAVEPCEALAVYSALREAARVADLVFCTHAMVGIDDLLRHNDTQVLPDYTRLFVDEAHQFEESLAGIRSASLSTWLASHYLGRHEQDFTKIRLKSTAVEARRRIKALMDDFRAYGQRHRGLLEAMISPHEQGPHDQITAILERHAEGLVPLLKKLIDKSNGLGRPLQEPLFVLENYNKTLFQVNFSPIRRLASLHLGPRSVDGALKRIWERASDGAGLFSGTLFVPNAQGVPSASYMNVVLSIPQERGTALPPVHPAWLTEVVRLHVPNASQVEALMPPKSEAAGEEDSDQPYNERLSDWLDTVASTISPALTDAAGGTLILMTSYQKANGLAERLESRFPSRLVVQRRDRGAREAEHRYRALAKSGIRPIWIATGGAWTGLDLVDADVEASKDNLLTTLIIPNLPLQTNRTTTHLHRRKWMKSAERNRVAMVLRQGVGRLVRRSGVGRRDLWVLDPRVIDPAWAWIAAPSRRVLRAFKVAT